MEELSATEGLALGLSRAFYALARTLRLNKLRDLIAAASLSVEAPLCLLGRSYSCSRYGSEEEALARLLDHFQSILWMSYRRGFKPIPAGGASLGSDVGWGCTLRSGQMILAQGLQRHLLGPDWRWPDALPAGSGSGGTSPPPELARLLQLFWDTPAERNAFSLHNLCAHGQACGVVPGRWLGPWVVCRALEAAARAALQHHQDLGLTVAVLADAGGGAPLLVPARFEAAFSSSGGCSGGGQQGQAGEQQHQLEQQAPRHEQATDERQREDEQQRAEGEAGGVGAALAGLGHGPPAAEDSAPELISLDSCTLSVEAPLPAAVLAASVGQRGGGDRAGSRAAGGGAVPCRRGLILLVPLVLGLGKLNPRYAPQLEAVLSWPQSIGLVGGRPSSSLYFVGWQAAPAPAKQPQQQQQQQRQQQQQPVAPAERDCQRQESDIVVVPAAAALSEPAPAAAAAAGEEQAQAAQQASHPKQHSATGHDPAAAAAGRAAGSSIIYLDPHQVQEAACCDDDWQSFHCEVPRSMALASIDPSLALGFYCGSLDEYRDLCDRLAALEARSGGAPLVCVASAEAAAAAAAGYESPHDPAWVSDELTSEEEETGDEDAVAVELENGDEAAAHAAAAPSTDGGSRQGSARIASDSGQASPHTAFARYQASPPPPPPPPLHGSPNAGPHSLRRASRSGSGWEVL